MSDTENTLPLAGIRVVEMSHVVMGSVCGLVLADMGADVIKVERAPDGDETRRYGGFGVGLFHFFNRNKKSLAVDVKTPEGKEILRRAIAGADVFIENFGPGAVERLGFGYEDCAAFNPGLVYCSLKGFLPGPYENRLSLDSLAQMMGGLAYMTGYPGKPLRAGASVTDIFTATFGVLGIMAALYERKTTGRGRKVMSSLFESTAFLVGQHMSAAGITQETPPPMSIGDNPWAIYDLFTTRTGDQIFIGIISNKHWEGFCETFGLDELVAPEFADNDLRRAERDHLFARIQERLGELDTEEAVALCDKTGIPFAPVRRPDELFDDPQLVEGGSLVETVLPDGRVVPLPRIPLRLSGHELRSGDRAPDRGEGSRSVLEELGYAAQDIDRLIAGAVIKIDEV